MISSTLLIDDQKHKHLVSWRCIGRESTFTDACVSELNGLNAIRVYLCSSSNSQCQIDLLPEYVPEKFPYHQLVEKYK
jgi:hypothetical protein